VTITIDTSALLGYFNAKAGVSGSATTAAASTATAKKIVPTAPWALESTAPKASELVRSVLAGRKFIDLNTAQLDVPGASQDYRKLFAGYQALNALNGLAERAATPGVTGLELRQLQSAFAKGMAEATSFLDTLKLDQLRLARGDSLAKDTGAVGLKRAAETYVTDWLQSGDMNAAAPAFDGEVQFSMTVKRGTTIKQVDFDLAEMGSAVRSLPNVVTYLNDKLKAAGLLTRFTVERLPNEPRTVTAGGKTVTLPAGPDQFALKVKIGGRDGAGGLSGSSRRRLRRATAPEVPGRRRRARTVREAGRGLHRRRPGVRQGFGVGGEDRPRNRHRSGWRRLCAGRRRRRD